MSDIGDMLVDANNEGYNEGIDKCIEAMDKMFVYTDSRGMDRYACYCQLNRDSVKKTLERLKNCDNYEDSENV